MSLTPYRPASSPSLSSSALQRFSPKDIGLAALFPSSSARQRSTEALVTSLLYHLLSTLLQRFYNLISESAINIVNDFITTRRQKFEESLAKKSEILQQLRGGQTQKDAEDPHAVTEAVKSAVSEIEDAEREEFKAWRAARKTSGTSHIDSGKEELESDRTRGMMCPRSMRGASTSSHGGAPRFGFGPGWGPRARMQSFFGEMPKYNTISECAILLLQHGVDADQGRLDIH